MSTSDASTFAIVRAIGCAGVQAMPPSVSRSVTMGPAPGAMASPAKLSTTPLMTFAAATSLAVHVKPGVRTVHAAAPGPDTSCSSSGVS